MAISKRLMSLGVALLLGGGCGGGDGDVSEGTPSAADEEALATNCAWNLGNGVQAYLQVLATQSPFDQQSCDIDMTVTYDRHRPPTCARKYYATLYSGNGTWLDTGSSISTSFGYEAIAYGSSTKKKGASVCAEGKVWDSVENTAKLSGLRCGTVSCPPHIDRETGDVTTLTIIVDHTFYTHNN